MRDNTIRIGVYAHATRTQRTHTRNGH